MSFEMPKLPEVKLPEVKFNKNGYEIRTEMLHMAQNQLWQDFHAKWGQYEATVSKDGRDVVTKIEMPQAPGVDQVLAAAERFYDFVNQVTKK